MRELSGFCSHGVSFNMTGSGVIESNHMNIRIYLNKSDTAIKSIYHLSKINSITTLPLLPPFSFRFVMDLVHFFGAAIGFGKSMSPVDYGISLFNFRIIWPFETWWIQSDCCFEIWFVTTLLPTIILWCCSYLVQLLAFAGAWTLLIMGSLSSIHRVYNFTGVYILGRSMVC